MDKFIKLPVGKTLKVGTHEVTIINAFAEGGFAQIYKVQILPPEHGSDIACLKRVLVKEKSGLSTLRTEVKVMKKLAGCNNIVQYYDSHASRLSDSESRENLGYEVLVLMELCPNGSLLDFMNKRFQTKLKEFEILKIMYEISSAVSHLHYLPKPLVHRDIKIENVLLDPNRSFKLCDFGSTTHIIPPAKTKEQFETLYQDIMHQTTPQYRCPEMIDLNKRLPIDEKSDIWALGVFLYKLCYYTTPFEAQGQSAIMTASFSFPAMPRYSTGLKNLITVMLQVNPNMRPNIYQVVEIVCQLGNLNVPIQDKYEEGPSKYYQMLNQQMVYSPPNQNQQKAAIQQSMLQTSQLPSAGSLPSSFSPSIYQGVYNPSVQPYGYDRTPDIIQDHTRAIKDNSRAIVDNSRAPLDPRYQDRQYTADRGYRENKSHEILENSGYPSRQLPETTAIKSLTETLLQTTSEMIEDNSVLKNSPRARSNTYLESAEVRYPSVDQLNKSSANDDKHVQPTDQLQYSTASKTQEMKYQEQPRQDSSFLNKPGLNIAYGSSSSLNLNLHHNNSSDLNFFDRAHSPSRQPSTKSKFSAKTGSRPSSYVDSGSNHFVFSENTASTPYPEADDYGAGLYYDGASRKEVSVEGNSIVDETNLLDYDETKDDFFGQLNPSKSNVSPMLNSNKSTPSMVLNEFRPKTPSTNPFPVTNNGVQQNTGYYFKEPSPAPRDKNPWAIKGDSPRQNVINTAPLHIVTSNKFAEEGVTPTIGFEYHDSVEKEESLNARLKSLTLETNFDISTNPPYPGSATPKNTVHDLLDINSSTPSPPSSLKSKRPGMKKRKSSKLNEYSSVKSAQLRARINPSEQIEVDLSSESSVEDDNDIEVQEEDPSRYLTRIHTAKTKLGSTADSSKREPKDHIGEFGDNSGIPMIPRVRSAGTSSSKSSSADVPSPVDALFEKRELRKSKLSTSFAKAKLKSLRTGSAEGGVEYMSSPPAISDDSPSNVGAMSPGEFFSPISIDINTKKKLGGIFSDSEDDSIMGDIRKDKVTDEVKKDRKNSAGSAGSAEDKEAKKLSRREKVKSFLGGHHHSPLSATHNHGHSKSHG